MPAAVFLVVLSVAVLWGQPPKEPRPLTEAEVLKLIELQIDDGAIVARIQRGGGADFEVTDAIVKKLRGAGASDQVIAALRPRVDKDLKLPDDPARETIEVWVRQDYNNDCPLVSELRVNGNLIDKFSSTSQRAMGKHVKMGWNTLTLKTTVRPEVKDSNSLKFLIGPTHKDPATGRTVMEPVLWSFTNRTDWSQKNGVYRHRLGPDVKEATLSFQLLYAGAQSSKAEVKAGDFVLQHNQDYLDTPIVTSTVFVNDQPLTTFLGQERNQAVITALVKKPGDNEVKVVTHRITNVLENNNVRFDFGGPAAYNATQEKFEMKPLLNFRSTDGWIQDKQSGQWEVSGKAPGGPLQRDFSFKLDE
jgi:hypothetical protein